MFCKIVIRTKLHSLIRFCNHFGVARFPTSASVQSISREVDRWFLSHWHHLIVTQRDTIARCESLNRKSPAEAERKIEPQIHSLRYSFLINCNDSRCSTKSEVARNFSISFPRRMRERRWECRGWLATEHPGAFYLVVSILSSGISIPASHGRVTDPYLGDTPSHPGWRFLGHTSVSGSMNRDASLLEIPHPRYFVLFFSPPVHS